MPNVPQYQKFFRDKAGKVVVLQPPNAPIIAAFACGIAALGTHGVLGRLATVGFYGFLGVWALLEAVTGVNAFRRTLGLLVLCYQAYNLWKLYSA